MSKINARKKGNTYELKITNEIIPKYPDAVSSRSESKRSDDMMKDIMYTGDWCIQCKATERSPSYPMILKQMKKNFPNQKPLIFRKENNKPETVTMFKEDFYKLWMIE